MANYGLSAVGITSYAPVPSRLGFMQKSFEVTVDNIDADLFGNSIPGGGFQPSDASWHRTQSAANGIVLEAYNEDLYVLEARRDALLAATEALLERETLSGEELEAIIAAHPAREPAAVRTVPEGPPPARAPAAAAGRAGSNGGAAVAEKQRVRPGT